MNRSAFPRIAMLIGLLWLDAAAARAAEAPTALVMSNSDYSALPKLPNCELSANLVAAALTRAGVTVTRRSGLSNARLGTAIADVGDAAVPGSRAVIYLCGYAVNYGDRLFVLPADAHVEREADVLTQGVIARLLMSSVAGPNAAAGLVLMDVAALPDRGALETASMDRTSDSAHAALVVATMPRAAPLGPAPVAAALADALGAGPVELGELVKAMSADPVLKSAALIARPPRQPSWLVGEPAVSPTAPPPAAPAPEPVAAPVPAPVAAPAAPASDPASGLADLNPAQRRRLQLALGRLGYYRGRVDGVFATDTAQAIRQYQRDSNAEPTGRLTAAQAAELLK